jgi:GAF domain-containing protein
MMRGDDVVHIPDVVDTEAYRAGMPGRVGLVQNTGARTALWVALRKDQALRGVFVIYRREVRPFTDKQIALLENFAAQAVIAMENARLITETREALEQQTATAEILQVINSSPGELAPVFDAILEKAHTLCGVAYGGLAIYDGEHFRMVATRGYPEQVAEASRRPFRGNTHHQRLVRGERYVHIPDMLALASEELDEVGKATGAAGIRSILMVPLRKDGKLLGHISASRPEVQPFSDSEISLLENFAAQAVIAMENARLITETREALEQQTATAEVLQVINSSPGDLAPVFAAILEKAHSLCDVTRGALITYDGEHFRGVAMRGMPEPFAEKLRGPFKAGPNFAPDPSVLALPTDGAITDRLLRGERMIHVTDLAAEPVLAPLSRAAAEAGSRTVLRIPLRKDGALLGYITAHRTEVRPFSDKQIALLENFAAQAVIAMENARLINETREALEQQTATAEVLGVINASPGDLGPVFDAMLEKAMRLCEASLGTLDRFDGEVFQSVALRGVSGAAAELYWVAVVPDPGSASESLVRGEDVVHIPVWSTPKPIVLGCLRAAGWSKRQARAPRSGSLYGRKQSCLGAL